MSSTRKARGRKLAAPATVTIERAWLSERLEWLDVNRFAMRITRDLNELAASHSAAFKEQSIGGACSERTAEHFSAWGLQQQHEILGELHKILESIDNFTDEFRDLIAPAPMAEASADS